MRKKLFISIISILLLLSTVSISFGNVQKISNLAGLFRSIDNESVFGTLSYISKTVGTESNTGKATKVAINSYWPTLSIIDQFGSGIDTDNVTYLYINIERLKESLKIK